MAMDQIIRHGLEFSAGIDKASQKQLRQVVRDIFIEESHIDLNNPENIKGLREFAETMQKILTRAGSTKFDFSKIIKLPGPEMFAEMKQAALELENILSSMTSGFGAMGSAFANGVVGGVKDAAKQLEAEFDNLIRMQMAKEDELDQLRAKRRRKREMEDRLYFDPDDVKAAKVDKNFAKTVSDVMVEYYDISEKLENAISKKKVTEPILQQWIDVASKLSAVNRAINDIGENEALKILKRGDVKFFMGNQFNAALSQGMDAIEDFIDPEQINSDIDKVKQGLKELDVQIADMTAHHPELISRKDAVLAEQRIKSVQEAYERLFITRGKKKGEISSKKLQDIEKALNYKGKGSKVPSLSEGATDEQIEKYKDALRVAENALKTAFSAYGNSEGGDWEDRSRYLIKAVAEYESILNNADIEKGVLESYRDVYEEIKAQEATEREKLQTLLTMGKHKAAGGDVSEINPKDIVDAARLARQEAEAEAKAAKEKAEALKQAADAAKQEKEANEASAKAKEREAAATKGILDNPAYAHLFKRPEVESTADTVEDANQELTEQSELLGKIQKLTTYIDDEYLSAGKHLSDFLNDLQVQSSELDTELKEILTTLNLIDESGKPTFSVKHNGEEGGGTTHQGALISDKFVLIERDDFVSVKNSTMPGATQDAAKAGMNVAEILGNIASKYTSGYFDVQSTATGHNLFENGMLSSDVVNATEEQLERLVEAFIKARDYGFDIENGGSNIVYDKEKGFSFYDLSEYSGEDAEFWNKLDDNQKKLIAIENLFSLFSGLNRDHSNAVNDPNLQAFTEKIKSVIESRRIISPDAIDDSGRNYEDIYDDVFSGDLDAEYDNVIAQLMAETNAHRENTEAINEEIVSSKENLNILKQISAAYEKLSIVQDEYDNADNPDKLEAKLDAAREAVQDLENEYHSAIITMQDGTKLRVPLDEEFSEATEGIVADAQKIQNIELIPRSAEQTIQAYERLEQVIANIKKHWGNLETLDRSIDHWRSLDEIEFNKNNLEKPIHDIEVGDPDFKYGSAEQYQQALQVLERLNAVQERIPINQGFSEALNKLQELNAFEWDDTTNEAYTTILKGIREGTFATVEESIAKFKELGGIIDSLAEGDNKENVVPSVTDSTSIATVIEQVTTLKKAVDGVTTSVNAKTEAFKTEGTEVGDVIDGEIEKLGSLEDKITSIKASLEKLFENIKSDSDNIGVGLGNITVNVNHQDEKNGDQGNLAQAIVDAIDKIKVQSPYSEMNRVDATNYISDNYDHDMWDGWYSKSIDEFRTQIAVALENDTKLRNAALNQMWDEYKHLAGKDIGFNEFLNTKIPLYRGETVDSQSQSERALSFSLTPDAAEEFGERVLRVWMRPIDTLGMANPTLIHQPEAEVMVPKDLVSGYDEWRKGLITDVVDNEGAKDAPWALESTLQSVKEVLDGIKANTAKTESLEVAPAKTDVGNVLATENTLGAIKAAVEAIKSRISKGVDIRQFAQSANRFEASTGVRPNKSDTKQLIKDYETLGKLRARFENDGDVEAKAQLQVLANEVSGKRESLQVTSDEIIELRKKSNIAYEAEKKLLDAAAQKKRIEEEQKRTADERVKAEKAAAKSEKKRIADEKKLAKRQAMAGKAGSVANRAESIYLEAVGLDQDKLPQDFKDNISDYYDAIDRLRSKHHEVSTSETISTQQQKALLRYTKDVNKLTNELSPLIAQYERLSGDNTEVLFASDLGDKATLEEYERGLRQAVMTATDGRAQIKGFDNETKTLTYTLKTGKREFTEYTAEVRNLDKQYTATAGKTKHMETFVEATTRKMKELTSYITGMGLISRVGQELRRGIQYIREIDKELTELRKVTNETEEEYDQFLKTAAKTGKRLGTTISAVTEATATFAKLGYEMEMAAEMAEAAIVYKNVGDNIESTGDAADSIISTLKGFGMEASEAMRIVDRFNEVGNKFAITSAGIGEALRLSASALNEGGNSLDESIALITAANEVVNDPSSVGTALKTLTLRLRGAKTELEDAGLDIENMATTTSQLQSKLLALTGGQVDIMADANTFKSSTQILREMAAAWEDMTDVQRASALELMGGKRQANVLSALISNFDTVEEAIEASAGSAGSALRENEVFLDSFEGRLQQLTSAAQSKWSDALDTDTIKDAIQLFTKLIETLNFEDSALLDIVGLLTKALSGLMDLLGNNNFLYTLIAFFGAKTIQKHGWLDFFTGLKKTGKETIESLTDDIKGLDAEIKSLTEEANKQSGRTQKNTLQQIDVKKQLKANKQEQLEAMKPTSKEQQEVAEAFDISKMQKKISGKKGAITRRGNELTKQGFTPEQIKEDPKIQKWNKDIKEGQQALEDYNNKIQQADVSLGQVNASTNKASGETSGNTGAQNINTGAQVANTTARQGASAQTDAQTKDINENTNATEDNTSAQNKNTKSLGKSVDGLKAFGKQMLQTMAYMALIQGAMQLLDGIAWGLEEAWNAAFPKEKTFEDLHDEFEEIASDLAGEKSELKGLEGELENVKSRIVEIQSLGTLSFTNDEELNNLEKQSAELSRQIEMQKILTKNKQRGANAAALSAANAYLQQSAEIDDTLEEATEKTKETGEKIGSIVDGALMVGGAILTIAAGWTGAGAIAGGAMIAAGMAGAGKGIGGAIGESAGESEYQKQQTNQQAIDSYGTKRANYQKQLDEAYAKGDADAYSKILEEYEKFETMMADNIGGLLEYISAVDYNTLSEDQKKQYEAYNRMVNQYSLSNGGSITDAVDSILGYDRYEKTGYEFDQIQEKLKDGDISAEVAAQQMQTLIDASPSLKSEFDALDIKIEDVIASYVKLGKAAQESVSLMSSLDKISAVTSAFDDLGSAVKEFKEDGRASAGTLESLNETFGNIDGFEELYKVLATGEGDLEDSITNVANAYVGQAQILSDMTDEELSIMTSRLQSIGVLNAEEVLMARQKGQAQLDALGLAYSIDLSNYGTAEQAKLAIAQAAGLNIASIADDQVEGLAKKYGVDLKNYASTEEAKIAIAQARAKAEAGANKSDLENKYKSGDIDYAEYMAGLTDIDNSLNFDSMSGVIQGIIDNAYQGFEFSFDGRVGIGSDFEDDWDDDDDGIDDDAESEAQKGWEKLVSKYENQLALLSNERDLIQAEIDKAEAKGGKASAKYYEDLKNNSEAEKILLEQKKAALEEYLAANAGAIDQDTWTDYNNEINATAVAIKECEINTIEWTEAMREIDLHYFEQASDEISRLGDELEFVNSLLEDEDVADENGNWSSAALTRMGIYTNQMEMAAANATRYQEKIDELNEAYAKGERSEEQYQEELSNLVSGQQDAIMSYEDAKDSIVELNEARIEAIREGIEKEIEAYEDLIDAKKEELDAERDLHDFRENVKKQTKDISELERRIASLSGSSAASDVAERRKLEAQLMEAKEGLNSTYYDHSRDAQSAALDEENEAYALSKERYIERLEEQLEETETLIQNSIMDVMLNADTVYNELNALADTYGVTLSDELTQPWKDASAQAIKWKDELKLSMTSGEYASLIGEGGAVTAFANGVATKLQGSWTKAQTAAKNYAGYLTGAELKNGFSNTLTGFGSQIQSIIDKWNGVKKAADDAYAAQTRKVTVGGTGSGNGDNSNNGNNNGTGTYTAPTMHASGKNSSHIRVGKKTDALAKNKKTIGGVEYYLWSDGYYYPMSAFRVVTTDVDEKGKKTSVFGFPAGTTRYKYYAKGTTGTPRNEWALTDEPQFGDELTMYATPEGTLSFMRTGSTVIPADITANLVEWGKINPDMFNTGIVPNVNMITNAINKPELNISFESLVKAENITEETLPAVKKLVTQELNRFTKELNYALKGKGAR